MTKDFGIEKVVRTSFYKVHAVPIGKDGKLYTVGLSTDFLGNSAPRTQDHWAQFSKAELDVGCYGYLSAPQIYGLVHALRINRDNPKYGSSAREIQEFLKAQHRKNSLVTSTRVDYMPSGKDVVTHEYSLPGQHEFEATIFGPDEWIRDTKNPEGYQALFETNNTIEEINYDFKQLNGTDVFAFKVNSRPTLKDARVVGLYFCADSDSGVNLHCCSSLKCSYPALGGKVTAEGAAKAR